MPFYKILDDAIAVDDTTFTGATSATMQVILSQAVTSGLPAQVRPGTYDCTNVFLSGPITVQGVPGSVVFRVTSGAAYILALSAFGKASFFGIEFNGQGLNLATDPNYTIPSLVNTRKDSGTLVSHIYFDTCKFANTLRSGMSIGDTRVTVENCEFIGCKERSIAVITSDRVNVINSYFEDQDYAVLCNPGASTNVAIHGNVIKKCRRNAIDIEPATPNPVAIVSRDISIQNNKISKLLVADTWAVARTDINSTGGEGNGILVYLCQNVVIEGNDVSDCQFSSIRTNLSSQVTVSGNISKNSGETAIYLESVGSTIGEFGSAVSGNIVYNAGSGISVVNFDNGGRFAAVSANVIKGVTVKTITYGAGLSYKSGGVGIFVEADCAVSGNSVEDCAIGIGAGTNQFTSDVNISGNLIRKSGLGIGVSSQTPKEILVANNFIAGFSAGAIRKITYNGAPFLIDTVELAPANRGSAASGLINMIGNITRAVI
jgi:uncharacterized secreted repeat protein (TIGR03808 family)